VPVLGRVARGLVGAGGVTTFSGDEDHGDDITSGPDDWDDDGPGLDWSDDEPDEPAVVDVDVRGDRL
jgi:hypothetical protein